MRGEQVVDVDATVAYLYWLEYLDAAEAARAALRRNDKLAAITLAIWAHKIRSRYEALVSRIILTTNTNSI